MPGPYSLPIRYDARELEGLPAPLQGYFRAAMKDGQSVITAVTLDMAGTFNMSPTGEQWKLFTSRQRVITRRPGFLWGAKIAMLPGVTLLVVDSYIVGFWAKRNSNQDFWQKNLNAEDFLDGACCGLVRLDANRMHHGLLKKKSTELEILEIIS